MSRSLIRFFFLVCVFLFSGISALRAQFTDRSAEAGINTSGQNRGVAVIDFDRDGWEDLYFTCLDGPNRLFRNQGDGTFSDVAPAAGLDYPGPSGAAVWGDLDNDGLPDLVLGNRKEPSRIYRNLGNGKFADITLSSGVANNAQVMSVNLADVDQDGWLDIYFANFGAQNALYRNNGDGTFRDFTYASGALDDRASMGAIFFDYDRDGDPDLYLTHDAYQPNILYQNNGQGFFRNVSRESGADVAAQGMGVDVADIDHDGFLDIYITNLYENVLLRNLGNGRFEDISKQAGVTDRGMGWGTVFLDYNNDTWPDIYVANETYFPVDSRFFDNVLYQNKGQLTFSAVTGDEALRSPYGGYGVASADVDQNGQPDLVIANSGQGGNQLLLNRQPDGYHWVALQLEGRRSNRSAVGARVVLNVNGLTLTDEVIAGSGFAGQNSLHLHFGLGTAERIDRLQIFWPGGLVDTYENLEADRLWTFQEKSGPTTGLSTLFPEKIAINISPNPTAGQFTVELDLPTNVRHCTFSLYSLFGQLILRESENALPPGRFIKALDLKAQPPSGIYLLNVYADGASRTEKLLFADF